ncbi:MAG: GntR family transcriptional regulator, partial [Balneolaceae bacterium]|nr:GntR family transcriptional regulator [Balneolaceae bacterium]
HKEGMMLKDNKPRHEQISDWLRSRISAGHFKVGDQLPSENELGERFDVSRVTVRHALKTLENEGIIYRRQGLGSFVEETTIQNPLVCLTDFDEDMKRAGLESSSKIITHKIVETEPKIAEKLDLDARSKVVCLDRLRMGDGKAIAFDKTWLPIFYGQLLEDHDLEHKTIYTILEEDYQIPILKGRYEITAASANAYIAEQLSVKETDALLLIDRISMTIGEKKVYYQQRFYRPDRITYRIQLERRDEESQCLKDGMPLKEFSPVFFNRE